jgi:hypothetical protein
MFDLKNVAIKPSIDVLRCRESDVLPVLPSSPDLQKIAEMSGVRKVVSKNGKTDSDLGPFVSAYYNNCFHSIR